MEPTKPRNRGDLHEDVVGRKRAVKVQLLERCHPFQVRDTACCVVRAAERGHVQVECDDSIQQSDAGQRVIGERACRTHSEERVTGAGRGERREVAKPRDTCIGHSRADEHTRERRLSCERGNGGVAGFGPLQVDAFEMCVLSQPLNRPIGNPAAA